MKLLPRSTNDWFVEVIESQICTSTLSFQGAISVGCDMFRILPFEIFSCSEITPHFWRLGPHSKDMNRTYISRIVIDFGQF